MQTAVNGSRGVGDLKADYSALLPLADNAAALVAELNLLLAANQISANNLSLISEMQSQVCVPAAIPCVCKGSTLPPHISARKPLSLSSLNKE